MNCCQTKQLLHDLADGRLTESVARDIQRHVAECSDCRVFQQRDRQLQQLLAVKRHETPGPSYFTNFLSDFHKRLAEANAPRPTFWKQLSDRFACDPLVALRSGFAPALGAAFVVALLLRGSGLTSRVEHPNASNITVPHRLAAVPSAVDAPSSLLTVAQADFHTPRYVLDRIAAAPASYDVASIHF